METVIKVKLVVLGDSFVGKTSIIKSFVEGKFSDDNQSTIGANFFTYVFEGSNKKVIFNIWDTAGQERFHSLAQMYYRDADAVILVYDITNSDSFASLERWIYELRENINRKCVLGIAANKSDLVESEKVNFEEAKAFARRNEAVIHYTSAKEGYGIDKIFRSISSNILGEIDSKKKESVTLSRNNKRKGRCCNK